MNRTATVKEYYHAFNSQDWPTMLSFLDPKVKHDINQGDCEVGLPKFKKFLAIMDEHYTEKVEDLVIMASEDGERVAAEFFIKGIYKKTAKGLPKAKKQKYHIRVGAFFEFKGDKISRVTNYYNLNDWIACVK